MSIVVGGFLVSSVLRDIFSVFVALNIVVVSVVSDVLSPTLIAGVVVSSYSILFVFLWYSIL